MSRILFFCVRVFVGFVFAYAGFAKLTEPVQNFEYLINSYEVIPAFLVPIGARILPWLEWVFGMYMILGYMPRLTSAVLGLFSLMFIGIILASGVLWQGPSTCGCFGEGGPQLLVQHIFIIDIVNSLIALRLFFLKDHPFSLDSVLKTR